MPRRVRAPRPVGGPVLGPPESVADPALRPGPAPVHGPPVSVSLALSAPAPGLGRGGLGGSASIPPPVAEPGPAHRLICSFRVPGRAVPWKVPVVVKGRRKAIKDRSLKGWQEIVSFFASLAMLG